MTSSADKQEGINSVSEWAKKIENTHMSRTDINKLIMNYLVTGNIFSYDCQ